MPTLANANEEGARVAGTYMVSRRGEQSFVKLLAVPGETSVAVNEDDGTISIADLTGINGKPKRWCAVAPSKFREAGGQDLPNYGRKLELNQLEWRLRLAVRIVFALSLIFIVAFLIFGISAANDYTLLSDRGSNILHVIRIAGVLGAIGSLFGFANAVHAFLGSRYHIWGKLQATVFALAALGFLWLIFAGNLLRFNSNF